VPGICETLLEDPGDLSRLAILLSASLLIGGFVFFGWLLFALPLALLLNPYRWPLRWPWTPLFGAVCGCLILAAQLRTWGSEILLAGAVGLVAGIHYGLGIRRLPR
jgi:hypothetical protein